LTCRSSYSVESPQDSSFSVSISSLSRSSYSVESPHR